MSAEITRRSLLLSLPALAMARTALAQTGEPTLRAHWLSHMILTVSDVKRSLDFYQGLFGMPIQTRQGEMVLLRIGAGPRFIALKRAGAGVPKGITYFGIAVDDFNVDQVLKTLTAQGILTTRREGGGLAGGPLTYRVTKRGPDLGGAPEGTTEIFFGDPDGLIVQLQDPKYAGGAGALGDIVKVEPSPTKGLLAVRDISHFTISAVDGARSNDFYKALFGLRVRAYQGATPGLAIGPTVEFLMFSGSGAAPARGAAGSPPPPPRTASINHTCLGMENFNVEQIQKTLESYGIKPREGTGGAAGPLRHYISLRMENRGGAKEGTPELYFTDPDGIPIQLQDVSYCGGGGYLGSVCPPL